MNSGYKKGRLPRLAQQSRVTREEEGGGTGICEKGNEEAMGHGKSKMLDADEGIRHRRLTGSETKSEPEGEPSWNLGDKNGHVG